MVSLANDPSEIAIEYLKKVGTGEVDLKPGGDTAIKESTSASKKESIRDYLKRMAPELKKGVFESSRVNVDGEYAAVLVRRMDDFDEASLEVYAVALVKDENRWKPAPVLSSFENAVLAYTVEVRGRLSAMEEWMARERVVDLEKMISERENVLREKIRGCVVGEVLEGDDLALIMNRFMDACLKTDRASMLGYLGGASSTWPTNWREKAVAVNQVVGGTGDVRFPWRLLTSPGVIRMIVHEEKSAKEGQVTMVCFDPAEVGELGKGEGMFVLHFPFSKDAENLWYLDLPEALLSGDGDSLREKADGDEEWCKEFVRKLGDKEEYEGIESFEAVEAMFVDGLLASDMRTLLRLADAGAWKSDEVRNFEATARMWWMMNKSGVSRMPLRLGVFENEKLAVVAYQMFSLGRAELYDLQSVVFRHDGEVWRWVPGGMEDLGKEEKEIAEAWVRENEGGWKGEWQKLLMESLNKVQEMPSAGVADDEQVKVFAKRWLEILRGRDVKDIMDCTAYLGIEKGLPMRAFRSLFYDMGNVQRAESSVMGIYRAGGWLAVGIRYQEGPKVWCSFLPLAVTGGGLKFLPELDLIEEKNRNRDFLNQTSFERLSKFSKQEDLEVLRGMFEAFKSDCLKNHDGELQ